VVTRVRALAAVSSAATALASPVVLTSCGSFGEATSNNAGDDGAVTTTSEGGPSQADGAQVDAAIRADGNAPPSSDMVRISAPEGSYFIDVKEVTNAGQCNHVHVPATRRRPTRRGRMARATERRAIRRSGRTTRSTRPGHSCSASGAVRVSST
jgi:BRCT domain type II-containing protein